jgi:hypothetical protein
MSVFDEYYEKKPPEEDLSTPGVKAAGQAWDSWSKSPVGSAVNRTAGIVVGAANAPLAFIKGAMNAQTQNPEEYNKAGILQQTWLSLGGGLESAARSIGTKGDWGEEYDKYYQHKTGSTMDKDFGASAPIVKFGLDLMMDPLFGPALAKDLAVKGVRSIPEFAKYLSRGEIPLGAKEVVKLPSQTMADLQKLYSVEAAEKVAADSAAQAERAAAGQRLVETLNAKVNERLGTMVSNADHNVVTYDPIATKSMVDEMQGLDDFSKRLLETTDDTAGRYMVKPYESTTIDAERAAQPKMFEGSSPFVSLDERNPELAKELENFLARNTGEKVSTETQHLGYGGPEPVIVTPGAKATPSGPVTLKSASGLAAGMDIDEEGNLTYDIKNGLLGTAGVAGGLKLFGKSRAAQQQGGLFSKVFANHPNLPQSAKDVGAMYDLAAEEMAKKTAITWEKVKSKFVTGALDVSGNIKDAVMKVDPDFGKQMVMRRDLVAGASSRASNMIEEYRGMVFDGLSGDEKTILDSIIQSKRTAGIDDYKGLGAEKHPMGYGGVEHMDFMDSLEKTLPKEVYADLHARADLYFEAMQEQLKMRFDEGLLSKEAYTDLSKHRYSPRWFMQHLEDSRTSIHGRISPPEKHIKALEGGSENLLWNNAEDLLSQTVYRTQDLIFKNRANKALHEFAQVAPQSGIAREAKVVRYTKDGKAVFEDAPGGHSKVGVFVDGERKEIIMPNKFADEWVVSDPLVSHGMAEFLQWMTGTKIVKLLATGINPAFALRNMPRDIALVWQSTHEYSKHMPIALGQMAGDFATVAPDVFKRTGRVKDYVNEGGGMNLLSHYGRLSGTGNIGGKIDDLQKVLGWVGETSEIWTRMALRERALKNGKSAEEATWIARRYLDFSQGGNVIKGLDNALPYLNAGIQGTRSLFRAAKEAPGEFAWKSAQLGMLAGGLYLANQSINPEAWKQVSDRDKEANFIITTPLSYTDSANQTRYLVVKIPKDQGQRVFTSFVESLMAHQFEGKYPTEQQLLAIGDLASFGSWPPVVSAAMAYMGNKDSWTMDDVWKGPKVNPGEEYTQDTAPAFQAMGNLGISPERAQRAVGKLIPQNNLFVGLVGGGLSFILNQFSDKDKVRTTNEMVFANPSVRQFVTSTSPYGEYRMDIERLKLDENTRRYQQTREIDNMSEAFFKTQDPTRGQKIMDFIQSQPEADQDRLIQRVERYSQTAQLPDRTWWVNVGALPTNAKAKAFLERFDKEDQLGKMRMVQLTQTVSGFKSDDFINALGEARNKQGASK